MPSKVSLKITTAASINLDPRRAENTKILIKSSFKKTFKMIRLSAVLSGVCVVQIQGEDLYMIIWNHTHIILQCKQGMKLYFLWENNSMLLLLYILNVLCCHLTSPLQQCQKLILVPAFNIWRADILIEPVVCSEAWGIAGDHPFAVLKSW